MAIDIVVDGWEGELGKLSCGARSMVDGVPQFGQLIRQRGVEFTKVGGPRI
jgi:hypothetical protein